MTLRAARSASVATSSGITSKVAFSLSIYFKQQSSNIDELVQGLSQKIIDFSSALEVSEQMTDDESAQQENKERLNEIVAQEAQSERS